MFPKVYGTLSNMKRSMFRKEKIMSKIKTDKILIVKPRYDAWPVGIAYVLACLEEHNILFDFIDASRSQNVRKDIRNMLSNNSYFAVASGATRVGSLSSAWPPR